MKGFIFLKKRWMNKKINNNKRKILNVVLYLFIYLFWWEWEVGGGGGVVVQLIYNIPNNWVRMLKIGLFKVFFRLVYTYAKVFSQHDKKR